MMIPVAEAFKFPVQFFDAAGLSMQTSDCNIVITTPSNAVSTAAGVYNVNASVFERTVTPVAGVYYWYGTTTDTDAVPQRTPTQSAVAVVVPSVAQIVAGIAAAGIPVTVMSPVTASMNVTVIRGDDYLIVDGRALSFTIDASTFDTTGATVTLEAGDVAYVGTVSGDTVTVELTDTETAAMPFTRAAYSLKLTLANGSVVTVVCGTITAKDCS